MEQLIELLASLPGAFLRARSGFVVCGSGPMAVRGMRDVHDLDLLVDMNLWDRLESGEFSEPEARVGACSGFERSEKYGRTIYHAYRCGRTIDVFATTPRMDETHDHMVVAGVERYQVPGVGLVAFQPLRGVLAIKALCPTKPKHLADMISIAQRLAIEEAPGTDEVEAEPEDVAAKLDQIAAEGVPQLPAMASEDAPAEPGRIAG